MKRQVLEVLSGKGNTSALTTNDLFILVNETTEITDIFVTGGTYSSGTTEFTFTNNTGGTFNVTGFYIPSATTAYKVFTALLTQSGGDVLEQLDSNSFTQNVTKGVTYLISNASNGDFRNVGAPDNNDGTYFVAINDNVPKSYSDAALIYNTGAPIATVLENTIGNIWFTFVVDGQYSINKENNFDSSKTAIFIGPPTWDGGDYYFQAGPDGVTPIYLVSKYLPTGLNVNNAFLNTTIEIRVYN
jgi:hypothetical protein